MRRAQKKKVAGLPVNRDEQETDGAFINFLDAAIFVDRRNAKREFYRADHQSDLHSIHQIECYCQAGIP